MLKNKSAKLCPECGHKPEIKNSGCGTAKYVICSGCGKYGATVDIASSEKNAVWHWNNKIINKKWCF